MSAGARVRAILAGAWRPVPPPLEPCAADELARVAPLLVSFGAAALAWRRLRDTALAASPEAEGLRQVYRLDILHAARRERDIRRLFTLFRSAGVEPILIKGWSVARLYPEKGLRPYGDIDLCVAPEQYAPARDAVASCEDLTCPVDLTHREVEQLDYRTWKGLYSRSRLVDLDGEGVRVLSPEDQLRVLCIHFLKEGARRAVWLCDIALAVESRPADFDWNICLGVRQPQADWVACSVALAHLLLGAEVEGTPAARIAGRLPAWLAPSVLRQWGEPSRSAEPPFRFQLRRPRGLLRALRKRWPNPLEAMVATMSRPRAVSALPSQLRAYLTPSRMFKIFRGRG